MLINIVPQNEEIVLAILRHFKYFRLRPSSQVSTNARFPLQLDVVTVKAISSLQKNTRPEMTRDRSTQKSISILPRRCGALHAVIHCACTESAKSILLLVFWPRNAMKRGLCYCKVCLSVTLVSHNRVQQRTVSSFLRPNSRNPEFRGSPRTMALPPLDCENSTCARLIGHISNS